MHETTTSNKQGTNEFNINNNKTIIILLHTYH